MDGSESRYKEPHIDHIGCDTYLDLPNRVYGTYVGHEDLIRLLRREA